MCSYKEQLRAVNLSIKVGKRAQATVLELGNLMKNAL